MSIFDSIRNPFNLAFPEGKLFDIPVGKYVEQPATWTGAVNKSQVYSMEDQCRVMREIYEYPPKSPERHRWIAFYLQTFCSSFCGVIHDPLSDDAPLVTFTDAEGNMEWFEALLDKMHNRTKEEVQVEDSGTIMDLFFKSEMGKEIEAMSHSSSSYQYSTPIEKVLTVKVTD